jgi:hypothetical protein
MATLAPPPPKRVADEPALDTEWTRDDGRRSESLLSRYPLLITALAMLLVAFATRAILFGNPLLEVDENFYLLVGDRMLHGALPYVDIWDRKPIGIFLLYAAIRLLGGTGIVQYQVVATLFAAGTATIIGTPVAAIAAGILYLLLLGVTGGLGGQTPVFYNLFVAAAAYLTLATVLDDGMSVARVQRTGMLVMLLLGIAMQIKYSAVFEGIFLGVVLLYELRRHGRSYGGVMLDALLLVAIAVAPTLLALGYYVWRGQTQAFVYANFLSIFARSPEPTKLLLHRLAKTWMTLHLPLFCVLLSAVLGPWRRSGPQTRAFAFVVAWIGAAIFGYLVFGSYFDHYALPLLVPISIGCAPLFGYRRHHIGLAAMGFMLAIAGIADGVITHNINRRQGGEPAMRAIVAAIQPRLTNCLYVFRGESLLYYETGSCVPSRYVFPSHLTLRREAAAIGIDPVTEIRRIFATHPSVVIDTASTRDVTLNPTAVALGRGIIARDYHLVASIRAPRRTTLIYQRNDAAKSVPGLRPRGFVEPVHG